MAIDPPEHGTPEPAPKPVPKKATEPERNPGPMKQPGQPNKVGAPGTSNPDDEGAAIQRPPSDS